MHDLGGDGPALLMAHATGFCGAVLTPLADHLAARFHCFTFDARGHGETVTPAGPAPLPPCGASSRSCGRR